MRSSPQFRGELEFALGHFQEAALSYYALAVSEPDNADVHYNLALCLQRAGRWDAAVDAFERVLRLDPEYEEAQLGLGACLLNLNRPEEALETFDQDWRQPALLGKAVALQLLDRFEEAGRIYEMLLVSAPNSEEVLSNLIAMSVETHDLERVREHSLHLLDICPQSPVALQGLATVALDAGDYQAATSYCDRILKLAPDCLEAWHNLRIAIDQSSLNFSQSAFAMHSGRK